jgi:hypothetical protein
MTFRIQETQMHTLLTSIVLCVLAQTATAQCVNPAAVTPVSAQVRPTAELISSAAAGTTDAPVLRRTSATESRKNTTESGDEEHRRPTGSAMLLAALALMSGIVLRRAGASRE